MNRNRRKAIRTVRGLLTTAQDKLATITGDEEDYRDAVPDNLQGSDRYYQSEEAIDCLNQAAEHLTLANDSLEGAIT